MVNVPEEGSTTAWGGPNGRGRQLPRTRQSRTEEMRPVTSSVLRVALCTPLQTSLVR